MSTCKDCVHYEICTEYHKSYWGSNAITPANIDQTETDNCPYFKDYSKFIELPCKVGDIVYYFDASGRIYKQTISCIIYGGTGVLLDSDVMFDSKFIGSKFFLSYEEAEKAFKEQSDD